MSFNDKHLTIAALSALLFLSVYHVFSLLLNDLYGASSLFLLTSLLSIFTLHAHHTNKRYSAPSISVCVLLFITGTALFACMLSDAYLIHTSATWFYIFILCNAVLLPLRHALRLNLLTLFLYLTLLVFENFQHFQHVESSITLILFTMLISALTHTIKDLQQKLRQSKKIDPITGCVQAKAFNLEHEKVKHLFERYNTPYSLICISYEALSFSETDLERWLKELSQLYQSRLRKTDLLCRFNSQKFMILLPNTLHVNAERLCAELKQSTEAYDFSYKKEVGVRHDAIKLVFSTEPLPEKKS